MMRITALVENNTCNDLCKSEHGLSLYIEMKDQVILSDTGQSDLLIQNAKILGKDLSKVSKIFLSHGHYDHSGGILPFCNMYPGIDILMHEGAFDAYYHKGATVEKYIGIDPEIRKLPNVHLLNDDENIVHIDHNIYVFSGVTGRRLWPEGNLILKKKEGNAFVQDDFSHEIYLVLKEDDKLILISGCAHNGILNILDHFEALYGTEPDVVISGFHMMRKEYRDCDLNQIRDIGNELTKKKTKFYTGHCTGEVAFAILSETMGDQIMYLHCGETIEI